MELCDYCNLRPDCVERERLTKDSTRRVFSHPTKNVHDRDRYKVLTATSGREMQGDAPTTPASIQAKASIVAEGNPKVFFVRFFVSFGRGPSNKPSEHTALNEQMKGRCYK